MSIHDDAISAAHDALDRMRLAAERGTGCRLTATMIQALSVTSIGQLWNDADPRTPAIRKHGEG